ncbi:MAG: conjugal transfer protein [Gammaproteobacteria bacterium]|nr:conjugal transfer protein [Gammaproteobacteria bacterium]
MSLYPMITKVLCLAVCGGASAGVLADALPDLSASSMQVARYSVMPPTATSAQADLMAVIINVRFPQQVSTVGEALDFLLRRSGYRLVDTDSPAMAILQALPLPAVHRQLGPLTLNNALLTLAGSAYRLSVDPLHRTLSFNAAPPLPPSADLTQGAVTAPQLSHAGKAQPTPMPAR